ncbi:hypothetical protein PsAD37_02832 [Pseudovibrio sp. Ad37]|nr:hypothetical protein PsAD37_02832 [Pseudovibrio sp. Ad37]
MSFILVSSPILILFAAWAIFVSLRAIREASHYK